MTETRLADGAGVQAVARRVHVPCFAWVKNSSSAYSGELTVWLPSVDRTRRTTATTGNTCAGGTAGATGEMVTTSDDGPNSRPNTLLLRGMAVTADGVALPPGYICDQQGNKISETSPHTGLVSCS
ncbi:MAG: hypothetical protein J7521_00450 [Caulobacter sp.]|nr:hypothetical protein [Caulobacter sp.]